MCVHVSAYVCVPIHVCMCVDEMCLKPMVTVTRVSFGFAYKYAQRYIASLKRFNFKFDISN